MQDNKVNTETRDFFKEPFTVAELERLIGERPITDFISTRAKSYNGTGWDKKTPTKKQAIAAMIADPTLLRRPILVRGRKMLIGFSVAAYEELVEGR